MNIEKNIEKENSEQNSKRSANTLQQYLVCGGLGSYNQDNKADANTSLFFHKTDDNTFIVLLTPDC